MPGLLTVDRLTVGYGRQRVLHDVSLDVSKGEMIALLGASGCGKTTLLRTISGFIPVESGTVRIAGRDVTQLPPEKRDTAMVFQSYALWPHMTVAQNIGYGLKLRGKPRAEIRAEVARILGMLGLAGYEERPVTQLSGGQRQRVALGRGLAVNPTLLLLDEPLSNLDARIRQQVRHEIKAIQTRLALTAVIVTHDREEAMIMADRIVVMRDGRIAQVGTPETVFLRPESAFVARFMGAENVLKLEVRGGGSEVAIPAARSTVALPAPARLPAEGALDAYFRTEAVKVVRGTAGLPPGLPLAGRVRQSTYPGGVWRYAVAVGDQEFLVDSAEKHAVGSDVTLWLPLDALHLFPSTNEN
ncbi:MAG: ABC transporter ATP-binding protein [Alphaproteobacteria bacterium]|nr:ABC transporter ATP-binding protein [Alphaproteobacteria bacterium]